MTHVTIMTGEDHRRKWRRAEREQILAVAFAPGAVLAHVARQFDVASSLIYTWRRQAAGVVARKRVSFSPPALSQQICFKIAWRVNARIFSWYRAPGFGTHQPSSKF
jgi:hypothetical protein